MQWSTKPQNSPVPSPKWAIEGSNGAEGEETEFGAGVDLQRVRGWSEFASVVRFSKIVACESCETRGRGGRESNLRLRMDEWTDGRTEG